MQHNKLKNNIIRQLSLRLKPYTEGPTVPAENLFRVSLSNIRRGSLITYDNMLKFADNHMKNIFVELLINA